MEGWRNNIPVRINDEIRLSGTRFASLLGNKAKDNEKFGTDMLAAKEKSISGASENMLGTFSKEVINGNHDAIIKGNKKKNIDKAVIIGGSAMSGSVV